MFGARFNSGMIPTKRLPNVYPTFRLRVFDQLFQGQADNAACAPVGWENGVEPLQKCPNRHRHRRSQQRDKHFLQRNQSLEHFIRTKHARFRSKNDLKFGIRYFLVTRYDDQNRAFSNPKRQCLCNAGWFTSQSLRGKPSSRTRAFKILNSVGQSKRLKIGFNAFNRHGSLPQVGLPDGRFNIETYRIAEIQKTFPRKGY